MGPGGAFGGAWSGGMPGDGIGSSGGPPGACSGGGAGGGVSGGVLGGIGIFVSGCVRLERWIEPWDAWREPLPRPPRNVQIAAARFARKW